MIDGFFLDNFLREKVIVNFSSERSKFTHTDPLRK